MAKSLSPSPFSLTGLLVGTFFALLVGLGAPYALFVLQGSFMAKTPASLIALFLFFLLLFFVNTLLGMMRRYFALTKADLVIIYIMMLMAATVPTQAFVGTLIPVIAGLYYYATPENRWEDIFFPYVSPWLAPQDFELVKDLFEGIPASKAIPWGVWATILGYWYVFFLALSFLMICMSTILHRQWSQHERLAYPMVQLPLQMIETGESPLERLRPFFKNGVMWLGFFVPFTLFSLTGLHHYFSFVPPVSIGLGTFWFFRDTIWIETWLSYAWVGFSYLVSLEISFSIWFFFLLAKVQEGTFNIFGISSNEQLSFYSYSQTADLTHQSMGACLVFVFYGLWIARRHLREVVTKAWNPAAGIDDSDELLSYRTAVFGLLGSVLFVALWLWHTGIPLVVLPMFMGVCLVFYIMVTRVVAAAGVVTVRAPMAAAFFVISGVGTSLIGTKGLVALTFTYIWQGEMRLFPMLACANSLKLAEIIPGSKKRLFWGMIIALICGLAGATWVILGLSYQYGGINLGFFMTAQSVRVFEDMARPLQNPSLMNLRGWVFTGVGGLIEGLLMFAHHRFFWWPLHPLGFVIGVGWLTGQIWFSVLVAWLLKLIVLQYGGSKLYNQTKPFFLGMILGEATVAGTWLVIDWIAGETGNFLTF